MSKTLSPLLFISCINAFREFRHTRHDQINQNLFTDILIYADNLTILTTSEGNLQRLIHHLQLIADKYTKEISGPESQDAFELSTKWFTGLTDLNFCGP